MKILLTVDFYEPSVGGTQKVVKELAERFFSAGHDVFVATTKLADRKTHRINGVKIIEFAITGNKISGIKGEKSRYQNYLISGGFDVILNYAAQQWTSDLMFDVLDQITAKKVIVPCGFSALGYWHTKRYFRDMPFWLKKYDAVIFTSKHYQDYDFALRNNIPNRHVIPNGASLGEFLKKPSVDIKKKLQIPTNFDLISLIGSHTGQKGHHEAMEMFKSAELRGTCLLIIANDFGDGCAQKCQQEAAGFNSSPGALTNHLKIIVRSLTRKETIAALFASQLFLFPSQIECSPLVIFEAMAAGLPFASTKVGNVAEIISLSKAGWLLPTTQSSHVVTAKIESSARLLNRIMCDKKHLADKGRLGRKIWQKLFTFEKLSNDYLRIFHSLHKPTLPILPSLKKTKKNLFLVDVVIPTYNTGIYLPYAIHSVMNQGRVINQLIIVDDGSTDKTRGIVSRLKKKYKNIHYVYQSNRGLSAARNTGIMVSTAEFIAFLDADDVWLKFKIQKQIEIFKNTEFKQLSLVYCNYQDIDFQGKIIKKVSHFRINKRVRGKVLNYFKKINYAAGSGSGVLVRRECFEKIGLFDESLRACEDWDMWLRIAEAGYEFDYVDKELVALRRRPDSMQNNRHHMLINSAYFFNKFLRKGYRIDKIHVTYFRENILGLMFNGPKNWRFLIMLRQSMSPDLAALIWPNSLDSLRALVWIFYSKAMNTYGLLKKLKI